MAGSQKVVPLFIPFDAEYYRSRYPVLQNHSEEELIEHWNNHGHADGLRAAPLAPKYLPFDVTFYRDYHPDLAQLNLTDEQLIEHWNSHGYGEGRLGFRPSKKLLLIKGIFYRFRPTLLNKLKIKRALARKTRAVAAALGNLHHELNTTNLSRIVSPNLPKMAWLTILSKNGVTCCTGVGVEWFDDLGFFEGVWAGDFRVFEQIVNTERFGSGIQLTKGHIKILPPTNNLEPIFIFFHKPSKTYLISNSLSLNIAATREIFDLDTLEALSDVVQKNHDAANAGILEYNPIALDNKEITALVILADIIELTPSGKAKFISSPAVNKFSNFKQYRNYLSSTIAKTIANGEHPYRENLLTPLTTISRGYDSPAVTVLAKENGCKIAATIDVQVHETTDSGSLIGEYLGIQTQKYPHIAGSQLETLEIPFDGALTGISEEFIATAGHGDDVIYKTLEPILPATILFTGTYGDTEWGRDYHEPGLKKGEYNKSLNEFRLRVGFSHIPVPAIGAFFPASITAIANSREMESFSTGNSYDRPIPRRIAESAGVPRSAFGQIKRAIAPDAQNRAALWLPAMEKMITKYQKALRTINELPTHQT